MSWILFWQILMLLLITGFLILIIVTPFAPKREREK